MSDFVATDYDPGPPTNADLTRGVIIVLSGGLWDKMNPEAVRTRMDAYVTAVNDDPFVQHLTQGAGLAYRLFQGQHHKHLHESTWRAVCKVLTAGAAGIGPVILVGHSYGGAAAVSLARCLQHANIGVDLLITADSVPPLDNAHKINQVPSNVKWNLNSHILVTPESITLPFPTGKPNRRESGAPLDGILNVGLRYHLGAALAHRNAFYDLAGGDQRHGSFQYPTLVFDTTIEILKATSRETVVANACSALRRLSDGAQIEIELESAGVQRTLRPQADAAPSSGVVAT